MLSAPSLSSYSYKLWSKLSTGSVLGFSFALSFVLASQPIGAQLLTNLPVGNAKALGLAHAVTADPPGIDSIHYNPAGLIKLRGKQRQLGLFVADFAVDSTIGGYSDEGRAALESFIGAPSVDTDPIPNGTDSAIGAVAMLPGFGLTKLPFIALPTAGFSYEIAENQLVFATGVYVVDGAGFEREKEGAARFQGTQIGLSRLNYFTPSLAWRVNDSFVIGGSIALAYQGLGFETDVRSSNGVLAALNGVAGELCTISVDPVACSADFIGPFDKLFEFEFEVEEAVSPSFNLGFLWSVTGWLDIGGTYRSGAEVKMEGDYSFRYEDVYVNTVTRLNDLIDAFGVLGAAAEAVLATLGDINVPEAGVTRESGTARVTYHLPSHYALGASMQLTPKLKFNIDYKITRTSVLQEIPIEFDQDINYLVLAAGLDGANAAPQLLRLDLSFEDSFSWSFGTSYQYSDTVQLRAGYEERPGVAPAGATSLILPFGGGKLVTLGVGLLLENKAQLDIGLGLLTSSFFSPAGTSHSVNGTLFAEDLVYNPYGGRDVGATADATFLDITYRQQF